MEEERSDALGSASSSPSRLPGGWQWGGGGGAKEQVSRGSLSPDAMAIERKSGQNEGNHLL